MISVKNITRIYGNKENAFKALDDVSFDIDTGESVAIIGKSGSGKSTLMHIISGLDTPQAGEVIVDGTNILNMNKKEIDKFRGDTIGFIFQSFYVEGKETCKMNVSLPLEISKYKKKEREDLIMNALLDVELEDKINNKAMELSGGQKQRLAIARAIVNNPKIILADEPTGNLDSETGLKVEDMLFSYNKDRGVTLIIVTHDQELADKCDKQIHIKDGKISNIVKREEV